ncbi:putative ferric-chelate reductase 1 isoform X2 [Ruditapes philippinarum]|uniref:putative ferric-chelate reductase 1 isoform X2 n=1 Tax=Ruditapes philippinarum TaxID=129788 RepID=UPI00295B71E2|nr:putative ferric-chelate reductase 1 isoform X2 [Ruditapes philippinarum]
MNRLVDVSIRVFVIISILKNVQCYPNGPPWATCLMMFPKHGAQRQLQPCPFQITANTSSYSPSDQVQLYVSAKSAGQTFKGIQIRARPKYGDTEQSVGEFIEWPTNKIKSFDCLGGRNNMIGHKNTLPVTSLELKWAAPNISVGNIEIEMTILKDLTTFWIKETVELRTSVPIIPPSINKLSPTFEIIDWSACGDSKGCFLYPRTCSGHDCYAAVTFKTTNDSVEFEMFGSQRGYVSVGFSEDVHMGDDEAILCSTDETKHQIQRGLNHELFYERQLSRDLYDIQGTYKDGRLYCRFKRPLSMFVYIGEGHTSTRYFDFLKNYYLMLAWGQIYDDTAIAKKHTELPVITATKVSLQTYNIVRGSSLPIKKQIHGALMLIAWMLLVCLAAVIATHFKNGFHNKSIWGSKLWFQIHRSLAVVTWLLTAASFILIFVEVGQMTEFAVIHSYLGITVMSASTLQVIVGILRPKPTSKFRNSFNWGHWFLGKSTIIVAVVTFFFAFNIDMIPSPQKRFANIVLGVFVGLQVSWEIWFGMQQKCHRKRSSDNYKLSEVSKEQPRNGKVLPDETDSVSNPSYISLFLYIASMLAILAAALASIFIF